MRLKNAPKTKFQRTAKIPEPNAKPSAAGPPPPAAAHALRADTAQRVKKNARNNQIPINRQNPSPAQSQAPRVRHCRRRITPCGRTAQRVSQKRPQNPNSNEPPTSQNPTRSQAPRVRRCRRRLTPCVRTAQRIHYSLLKTNQNRPTPQRPKTINRQAKPTSQCVEPDGVKFKSTG